MSEEKIEALYTITELLTERDEIYSQYTTSAMEMIENVLIAAESMLDSPTEDGVEWKAIELGEKGSIIVVGVMTFPIGAMVSPDGDSIPVMIDEDNQDDLKKILRIGIDPVLASTGTVEEIQEFFKNRNEELSMKELNQRLKDIKQEEDFDVDGLTDEQKEKLMLFTKQQDKDTLN